MDDLKSAVGDMGATLNDAVTAGAQNGAGVLARARDKVSASVANANGEFGGRLRQTGVAGNARRAVDAIQENPIGLGLAALAIGFLSGSLLPVSEAERRRLNPIGQRLATQAQAATNDIVAAGKAIAAETAQVAVATALSSAKTHGSEVVDAAKTRAGEPFS